MCISSRINLWTRGTSDQMAVKCFSGLPSKELLTSKEWDTLRLRFVLRAEIFFLIRFPTLENSLASKRVMKSLEKQLSRRLFNSLEEISIALDMARPF